MGTLLFSLLSFLFFIDEFILSLFFFCVRRPMGAGAKGYLTITAQAGSVSEKVSLYKTPPLPRKGQQHSRCHSPPGCMVMRQTLCCRHYNYIYKN